MRKPKLSVRVPVADQTLTLRLPLDPEKVRTIYERNNWTANHDFMVPTIRGLPDEDTIPFERLLLYKDASFQKINVLFDRIQNLGEEGLACMNHFANQLWWDTDIAKKQHTTEMLPIDRLLELAFASEQAYAISGLSGISALGEFLIENEMVEEMNAMPEGMLEQLLEEGCLQLNYAVIAKKHMSDNHGFLSGNTYYEPSSNPLPVQPTVDVQKEWELFLHSRESPEITPQQDENMLETEDPDPIESQTM